MSNCSNGCDECKPNDKCDSKSSCCSDGSCDCDAKYATAYQQAMKDNGLRCLLCGNFYTYSLPNRCDGTLICYKCKTTRGWQIPKGKWKKR